MKILKFSVYLSLREVPLKSKKGGDLHENKVVPVIPDHPVAAQLLDGRDYKVSQYRWLLHLEWPGGERDNIYKNTISV